MSKHKNLKRNLLICLLAGSAVMYTLPLHAATSVVANNALPQNGQFFNGNEFIQGTANEKGNGFDFADIGSITKPNDLTMNVHQNNQNAVIKWDSFDVGGSATVNFKGPQVEGGYNTLNYVNAGGSMSQIYGTINANNNGNIFIVNPAGVQIGNSAQINVGSLYVSNKNLDNVNWKKIDNVNPDINSIMGQGTTGDAVLMSLGNINAGEVTFEGNGRIVIDSERIKDAAGDEKLNYQNINIKTSETNKNNIIIGYEAYDETITNGSVVGYDNKNTDEVIATVTTENGTSQYKKANGYMWVEDVEQLQAIGKNANTLSGNYALRNSIDATSTANWNEVNGTYAGFNPIGLDETTGKVIVNNNNEYGFTGNFDGLDYNIFGLTINRESEANVGLFGVAHNANINNVTLVGGSITGGSVVGSVIGAALGNTHITNATNSASVTGNTDVGGIVGYSGDKLDNDGSEIKVEEGKSRFTNLINTGSVYSKGEQGTKASNAGGLIGYMYNGTLDGNSYNLGNVSGKGYNVGGLVGHAVTSVIGNPSVVDGKPVENVQVVYNRLDVSGAYNVGGIVGNMEGSTVQNAENSGTVTATGYTTEVYKYHTADNSYDIMAGKDDDIAEVEVAVANVGGIVGTSSSSDNGSKSAIINVENSGDISSSKNSNNEFYDAGNIGGIIGRANNTDITSATNRENEIRGAHNIGGVAGYLGGNSTVSGGINDGGDIMATGARAAANSSYNVADGPGAGDNNYYGSNVNNNGFALEHVRNGNTGRETFIIGNMGGIVGYMEGKDAKITGSANRGTVHTFDEFEGTVPDYAKAANAGGVVGKIDRVGTLTLADLQGKDENNNDKILKAAVSNSYNTGDVMGYSNVGGIVGMMYNGEVAGSYNLGYISTTRQPGKVGGEGYDALNMGGIVGDTTEGTEAEALLYDVYNKGQIGDSTYTYYGRHVAGIVGRLSGDVEKAYNNGAIYNAYAATGGIAGWMYKGSINNAFNTGNITVNNRDSSTSQVGGIVGAVNVGSEEINLTNLYNLGTLRSFKRGNGNNAVGGIVGAIMNYQHNININISNAYTTGNIYVDDYSGNLVKSIYGEVRGAREYDGGPLHYPTVNTENTYYIQPDTNLDDFDNLHDENNKDNDRDNSNKAIDFNQKHLHKQYQYIDDKNRHHSLTFTQQSGGDVDGGSDEIASDNNWRIYAGNTPILNAFLPDAEGYFSQKGNMAGIGSIQYGTAYDPLLTIINAATGTNQLKYEWDKLGISNAAGLVVYGAGLTLGNVNTSGGSGYFGGTIYADGALNLNGGTNDIGLGSAADIYGSAVNITTDGKVTIYGDVTATGNTANGATSDKSDVIDVKDKGNITISASDVDVYGTLTSASNNTQDATVTIPGIEDSAVAWNPGEVSNPNAEMADIADRFAHTTGASAVDGNITINAGTKLVVDEDGNEQYIGGGNVNLYYGNKGEGITTTGGDLTVTGTGDVYVDSDLDIGGDLKLKGTGADSEVVLDITNIGEVQEKNDNTDKDNSTDYLHDFLEHFANTTNNSISFGDTQDAKITVDMWNGNTLDLTKFNNGSTSLVAQLGKLHITDAGTKTAQQLTHIWVSNGEQLNGIQKAANSNDDVLSYNFALKNDINASDVKDYVAIGTDNANGFTGTFDGRGNRIIGLTVDKVNGQNIAHAGIFSTVGEGGVVKDVNIYSGTFTGTTTAGAVAGVNSGRIEGIVTFGNTVTSNGNAGGIVGVNNSGSFSKNETTGSTNDGVLTNGIYDVESTGSVIAGSSTAVAGGLVGTNDGGLANSFSDSAVTVKVDNQNPVTTAGGLGGVVGVNTEKGNVQYVDSLGVTNGGATGSSNIGGIIGTNNGNMYSGYNESIVSGNDKVGGIIGENKSGKTVSNVVNATSVTGATKGNDISEYVGGLVGSNSGSVTNGRNNGTITGTKYVGGMVGSNAQGATLTNLVNDSSAEILGVTYVGGIAGSNSGTITADEDNDNLVNRGSITGHTYVGGVAGVNTSTGKIANTNNSVVLNANEDVAGTAEYFGGVVGQNSGLIDGATNTSDIDITAVGGSYVGGIIGQNTASGRLEGKILNQGSVAGKSNVGGIIGLNENEKVLQGAASNRLTVTNEGNVTAEDGGAAGIFYANTGNISYADITNTGTVTGGSEPDSVTGGLFGTNSGEITNSTLTNTGIVTSGGTVGGLIGNNSGSATDSTFTNSGTVSGNTNVGGLFGTNSGKFETSSLINTVNGQVIGTNNVGGLIGYNTGEIIGGRKDVNGTDVGYYKYKIYNNGVITIKGNGSNIGGLIGNNTTENGKTGSLTAGYNTGAINASGSTNVGGIAGSNSGTIDQVFNTVYNTDGTKGAITGGTNVGGLVGTNSGTLSNAYNTTAVNGAEGSTGNAVGVNDGKDAKVNFVYDVTNTKNKLIGKNAGSVNGSYALQESGQVENAANGIAYISVKDKNDKGQYTSLTGSDWKFYDGQQTPLLSVFLTKVKINQDKVNEYMSAHKVYNGTEQKLTANDIKALIDNEAIYVEGLTKEQAFEAFYNNIDLISSVGHTNAGQYSDWLYSQQIASSGSGDTFNPNNLGYDIALTGDINKVKVDIDLNTIERIYGDTTILNNGDYGYSYEFTNADKKYEDVLKNQLKNVLDFAYSEDGALIIVNGEERTNNKGDYTYKGTLTLNSTNFEFVVDKGDSQTETSTSSTLTTYGTSIVHAKKINVDDFLATIVYGNKNNDFVISGIDEVIKDQLAYEEDVLDANLTDIKTIGDYEVIRDGRDTADVGTYDDSITANISINNGNYELTGSAADGTITGNVKVTPVQLDIVLGNVGHEYGSPNLDDYKASIGTNGLVNGDNGNVSIDVNKVVDDALKDNNKYTDNVGDYTWVVSKDGISANGFNLGNYIVTVTNEGKSEVTPAKLNIKVDNANTTVGKMPGELTGTVEGLTNGDTLPAHDFALNDDSLISVSGNHEDVIGIVIGGKFYELGDADWSNGLFANYDVNYEMGDLAVSVVEIPDNWPNNRWDYLFGDNPFDRNENLRERKAEVNFVDGAMEI